MKCAQSGRKSSLDFRKCPGDFTLDISAVSFAEDGDMITASVLGGMIKSETRFEEGLGCALVKPG